jgi:hypothetical protein
MAYAPYDILFTDQNPNREFIIQPETTNGPSSPTGGVDPSSSGANTTLFLYGQGSPNYGDRTWENMVYMLEHFFNPNEPSFPIPGQIWAESSSNEITNPFQLHMYNPRKYAITASTSNQMYVVSDDASENATTVLARFQNLGLTKAFNVYDQVYNTLTFIQTAVPFISGSAVVLTVTPAITASLVGQFTGGWEEIYQGNCEIVLRRQFNAGGYNLINLANPINAQDAATKIYVDSAINGGTLTLAGLSDVSISGPTNGQFLTYNGTKWTNSNLGATGFLPLTGGTMTGSISMGGYIISNLPAPVDQYDATNKTYVDSQPLSGANVSITTPANLDLLYYNLSATQWENGQPSVVGVVPIAGGVVMGGGLDMGNNYLTGLINPVNLTDAVNLQYLNSIIIEGSGVVTSGALNNSTGVLTLTISGGFPAVAITGFLPTNVNNQLPTNEVAYTIPTPATSTNQFFALEYGQTSPVLTTLNLGLNQVDAALGNFIPSRQQLVFAAPGTRTVFDINNLAFASPSSPPGRKYVKGSHNLQVYINGVKQISSTAAIALISTTAIIRDDFDITFAGGSCTVQVDSGSAATLAIGTQSTIGAVRNAINALALSYYINPIVGYFAGTSFVVAGNVAAQFTAGTNLTVRYSTNNSSPGTYTVATNAVYSAGQTTIPVGASLNTSVTDGVIFQDKWAFSTSIQNGQFLFHSNIPGNVSTLNITDSTLFSGITGITYPFTFSGSSWNYNNSLPPTTYAYNEIGMNGYQSSLFVFNVAPVSTDVIELIIDREMVYNSINPLVNAIIA